MVLIEFYDKSMAENLATYLASEKQPEKVILVGDCNALSFAKKARISRFIHFRSQSKTDVEIITYDAYNLPAIVNILDKIVQENDECYFDVTGGNELAILAVGIIYERYVHKGIHLHQFNIEKQVIEDIDRDGITMHISQAVLSVEENIWLHGGDIFFDDENEYGTHRWDFSNDVLKTTINLLWEINSIDPISWNKKVLSFSNALQQQGDDPLNFDYHRGDTSGRFDFSNIEAISKQLEEACLIRDVGKSADTISFSFCNEFVEQVMQKAGNILELYIALICFEYSQNGSPFFNDVLSGVFIDWDGINESISDGNVTNEIDVILMRGLVPIFISCKNGNVTPEELYKFDAVANEFGAKYVRKILITNQLSVIKDRGKNANKEVFLNRAEEMGITVISNAMEKTKSELIREIIKCIEKE